MSSTITSLPSQSSANRPGTWPPGRDVATFLKFWTMGLMLSSIAYGVALTLSISTLCLLNKSSKKERKHYVLIFYVVVMVLLGTVSIISGIRSNLQAIYESSIPSNLEIGKDENAIIVVLVTWGSDGFLLWRAAVLYEGIATLKRATALIVVGFLMFAQLVSGILYILYNFMPALRPSTYSRPIFIAFATTTLSVNWIITALVVFRIGQYRTRVSSSLGRHYGRPFRRVIEMCIESAMLIIVFSTILLVNNLTSGKSPFSLSRILLVQIYIIAPLLILYRVGQDKTFTTDISHYSLTRRPQALGPSPPGRLTLRFQESDDNGTTLFASTPNVTKTVEEHIARNSHNTHSDKVRDSESVS